jgi:serine/threonine protein kinase
MPLTAGTKLGPYEIQSPLGAGGMGEVYRPRDTRLDRAVRVVMAEASGSRTHRRQDSCRPPVLKIIQRVLIRCENSLFYSIRQGLPRISF